MNITIHGKNLTINQTIENAVNKSLVRMEKFKKFINSNTVAKVEIRSYKEKTYKVKVNITLPYKKNLHCEIKNNDLFVAIKNIVHPLTQQLNHFKNNNKENIPTSEFLENKIYDDEPDYEIDELE